MKKIYNRIPLVSVLYSVNGYQKVQIDDYIDKAAMYSPVTVFSGKAMDIYRVLNYKQEHAEVRGISACGDVLKIAISTANEF